MHALINDLLAFSRLGRAPLDQAEVDLEKVFASSLDALSLAIDESGALVTHDRLPLSSATGRCSPCCCKTC